MRNKQQTFNFWSLLIDEYLEVTFEYWKDLDDTDTSVYFFNVTEIHSNGLSVPKKVKDEINDHISFEIYNLIEE